MRSVAARRPPRLSNRPPTSSDRALRRIRLCWCSGQRGPPARVGSGRLRCTVTRRLGALGCARRGPGLSSRCAQAVCRAASRRGPGSARPQLRRTARGAAVKALQAEGVAGAAHGVQEPRLAPLLELLPEVPDVDGDHVVVFRLALPARLAQLAPGPPLPVISPE